jgi:hypothetical protein
MWARSGKGQASDGYRGKLVLGDLFSFPSCPIPDGLGFWAEDEKMLSGFRLAAINTFVGNMG